MSLPSHIADQPNVAWLRSLTALTPDELRQRDNHSDYGDARRKPLDVAQSDEFAREIWAVIDDCAAETSNP